MTNASRLLTALALGVLLLHLAGCSGKGDPQAAPERPNVLLVVADTLRADKLGCYGSDLGATPRIDALAGQSLRFEVAYAHAPWTLPSFATLLTSLLPPQHGAGGVFGQARPLPEAARTLAECFRDAGYTTASVVNVEWLIEPFGLTQGFNHVDFEVYPDNSHVRSATRTTDAAASWLRERPDGPFFLMVHYFDPHLVYAPPPEYRRKFAAPEDQSDSGWVFGHSAQILAYRQGQISFDAATIRRAEMLYNGEVACTDHEIGRLLDITAELGLADSTVVLFTSDHGEEFLDHGGFEHGHTLYDELMRAPLLIQYPRRIKPGVVAAPAGLVDVAPTLCSLAGIPADPAFVGRDLLRPPGHPDQPPPTGLFLQGNLWGPPYRAWLNDGYKLIVGPRGVELFNLHQDPREQTNLRQGEPERLQIMRREMTAAFEAMLSRALPRSEPAQVSPEQMQRLRSLGYVP